MKKIAILTLTALTFAGLGGQALTAQASSRTWHQLSASGSNKVFVGYGSCGNLQDIWGQLEECLPGITLPDCDIPDVDLPETDIPDTDTPDVDAPETDIPDADAPGTDLPGNDSTDVPSTPDAGEDNNGDEGSGDSNQGSTHAYIQQIVDLVNEERAREGLSPLTIDLKVQAAAQVRAKESEQLFSHTRPDGSSFSTALKEQGVSYRSAGENIAWGQRSPEEVMNGWMNSSGHRANIMNPDYTTIGVGYYQNANGTNYWCQLFTR